MVAPSLANQDPQMQIKHLFAAALTAGMFLSMGAPDAEARNRAKTHQRGLAHESAHSQHGDFNDAITMQGGYGHYARGSQRGYENFLRMEQYGVRNRATTGQDGERNYSVTGQEGRRLSA